MAERVKVTFQLNPQDQQVYETEQVWAEPVGPGEFRILNSPFFVFGVSAEDVVNAIELPEGIYKFHHIVMKGGHSTYRIFLQGGRTIADERFRLRWAAVEVLGTTFESANSRFVSVDIPPRTDIAKAYELLEQGAADGVWVFEDADYARTTG